MGCRSCWFTDDHHRIDLLCSAASALDEADRRLLKSFIDHCRSSIINLLKDVKERHASSDLGLIYDRVVFAEEKLWSIADHGSRDDRKRLFIEQSAAELKRPLLTSGLSEDQAESGGPSNDMTSSSVLKSALGFSPDHDLYWLDRQLELLYRDYLDGAILHHSDIKTTEQLLGNLALRVYSTINLI